MTACKAAQLVANLVCGAVVLPAQTSDSALGPIWIWPAPAGMEWVAAAGRGDAETLIVATRDARLHLLSPSTGKTRLAAPLETARGIRFVPTAAADGARDAPCGDSVAGATVAPADVAYCFDRHAVCAIQLSDPPGLKWRYGRWPASGEEFPGDPEALTGWMLAQVTDAGVLLVNSDGRVVLLSHADGTVRWQIELDRVHVARLHVCGDIGALLWRAEGKVQVVFLNLADMQPVRQRCDLGELWPVWSTLFGRTLLSASPQDVVMWPLEGTPRRLSLPPLGLEMSIAGVFQSSARPAAGEDATSAWRPMLLVAEAGQPAAYDLATGKQVWSRARHAEADPPFVTLALCGTHVLVQDRCGAEVCDAATGESLAYCRSCSLNWLGAKLTDRFLYTVARKPNDPHRLLLFRHELATMAQWATNAALFLATGHALAVPDEIRDVVWSRTCALLVEPNELRAYTLP